MTGSLVVYKMSMNSNKRKNRPNTFNKFNQSKGIIEKNMASDGVYGNSRLMHTAASLVGCIVQIQVRNGTLYEGIFRTFSNQLDLVLEMPHKVDQKTSPSKSLGPAIGSLLASFPFEDGIADKLIFRLKDVVMLKATNVDLEFAIKDNFTDTAISKFNGQITERELEPWEGPVGETDSLEGLGGGDEDEGANGWDANDMFRTNAEKYGVKSSYDNTLQDYTVPLQKKNTEEYRKQEAKAMKIAQEIEANISYQSHIQLENGDEEDRFSAVVRPEGNNNVNRFLPPQRRKPLSGSGPKRPSTLPTTSPLPPNPGLPRPYTLQPSPPTVGAVSSSVTPPPQSQGIVTQSQVYKPHVPQVAPPQPVAVPLTVPQPASLPLKQSVSPPVQTTIPSPAPVSAAPASMPLPNASKVMTEMDLNGEENEKDDADTAPVSESMLMASNSSKISVLSPVMSQPLPPRPERRREIERKGTKKGRDDEIEEFKKFSSNFKLSEETKEPRNEKDDSRCSPDVKDDNGTVIKAGDLKVTEKSLEQEESKPDITKISKLNPNAKEFVLNPNAKSFTPRSMAVTSPHAGVHMPQQQHQQPQRIHAQSPVMAVPHAQMMPGMGQPVFATMGPQYIMQATPVSMALTSPFTASITQAPRLRKVPIMQPRHDISPSMHVAAATGQPILASNPISNPSQLTMQYTPPHGMIHAPGGPQQTMAYPQMSYVVGARGMSPQPVGMVPTSHAVSYDTSHINAHVFMPAHPSAAALSAVTAAHSMQQGAAAAAGQHSSQHPPQSHTPVIHPSPSPVHQPPPAHVNPSQQQTPTTVMYPGPMSQHALQSGHHNPNQPINAHVTHHANFPAGAQPVVLMQQQALPGSHPHHSGPHPVHLHSLQNAGSHIGAPTQIMPQMTVIPTSATMVSAPNTMVTSPFMPHPQAWMNLKNSLLDRENATL